MRGELPVAFAQDFVALSGRQPRRALRMVEEYPPQQQPDETDRARDDEPRAPAIGADDRGNADRAKRRTRRRAGTEDGVGEGALGRRKPFADHPVRRGPGGRLAHAHHHPAGHDDHVGGREAGADRRQRPQADAAGVDDLAAEAVDQQPDGDQAQDIGPQERRQQPPHFRLIQPELLGHRRRRDRQRDPVGVVDGGKGEQKNADPDPAVIPHRFPPRIERRRRPLGPNLRRRHRRGQIKDARACLVHFRKQPTEIMNRPV